MARRGGDSGSSDLYELAGLALVGIGAYYLIQNPQVLDNLVKGVDGLLSGVGLGGILGGVMGGFGLGPVGKGLTPEALGLKATGNKVAMEKGANHENGQRYNVNHKFTNYVMIGIFKIGKGQEVIEMKTDGPNHGSCKSLPKCVWLEPDLEISSGEATLGAEFPHPENHNKRPCPSCQSLGESLAGKEIGFAVAAWQTGEHRTVAMWVDPTGTGNSWKKMLQETDTGQITESKLATRKLYTEGKGLEAEIRMHGAKSGDTSMKDCYVYEIQPVSGAASSNAVRRITLPPRTEGRRINLVNKMPRMKIVRKINNNNNNYNLFQTYS